MLILSLHHRLDARQLPWATLALALLNLFVFLVLQSGDDARETQARKRCAHSCPADAELFVSLFDGR